MKFRDIQIEQQKILEEQVSRSRSIKPPSSTCECINGIHLVTTFKPRDFTEGDAFAAVPEIIKTIYGTFGIKISSSNIKVFQAIPDILDVEQTDKCGKLIIAFAIGMNKSERKWHIHLWIYGAHKYNIEFSEWCFVLKKELSRVKSIGDQVFIESCFDGLDQMIRKYNGLNENYWQPLVEYLTNRNHNNLMGYFTRNNPNTFYHYEKNELPANHNLICRRRNRSSAND